MKPQSLRLILKIALSNLKRCGLPYKVTFALTYRCDLKCANCATWARPPREELSTEELGKVISSLGRIPWLQFTGGEIFTREDIEEVLERAAANRELALLTFPTNGSSPARIERAVRAAMKRNRSVRLVVTCGLEGTREVHDRLRGVEGSFERCVETFRRLRGIKGVNAYLGILVSKKNHKDLPFLFEWLDREVPGFDPGQAHFNFAARSFFYNNLSPLEGPCSVDGEVCRTVESIRLDGGRLKAGGLKGFLEKKYFSLMSEYLEKGTCPARCRALDATCFIDPYGDVYPCIGYGERAGNLRDSRYDLELFWCDNRGPLSELRKKIEKGQCPGCWTPCEAYPSILSGLLTREMLFENAQHAF